MSNEIQRRGVNETGVKHGSRGVRSAKRGYSFSQKLATQDAPHASVLAGSPLPLAFAAVGRQLMASATGSVPVLSEEDCSNT